MAGKSNSVRIIDAWFDNNVCLDERVIYLGAKDFGEDNRDDGIDTLTTEYFLKGMQILNKSNSKPINVILNSIGGSWFHGMAIYDSIRASKSPVDITAYGHVMSMGAVIFQAGNKRSIMPNAALMVHDGFNTEVDATKRSSRNWSNYDNKHIMPRMYQIFAERSGKTVKFWKNKCSHDTIYSAEGAVKVGLADEVLTPRREFK